jgi:hypothetical protein
MAWRCVSVMSAKVSDLICAHGPEELLRFAYPCVVDVEVDRILVGEAGTEAVFGEIAGGEYLNVRQFREIHCGAAVYIAGRHCDAVLARF